MCLHRQRSWDTSLACSPEQWLFCAVLGDARAVGLALGGHQAEAEGPWKQYGESPWLTVRSLSLGLPRSAGGEGVCVRQGPRTDLRVDLEAPSVSGRLTAHCHPQWRQRHSSFEAQSLTGIYRNTRCVVWRKEALPPDTYLLVRPLMWTSAPCVLRAVS